MVREFHHLWDRSYSLAGVDERDDELDPAESLRDIEKGGRSPILDAASVKRVEVPGKGIALRALDSINEFFLALGGTDKEKGLTSRFAHGGELLAIEPIRAIGDVILRRGCQGLESGLKMKEGHTKPFEMADTIFGR